MTWFKIPVVFRIPTILSVLCFLDALETELLLQNYGSSELNPLGFPLCCALTPVLLLILFLIYPSLSVGHPKLQKLMYFAVLFRLAVVLWNFHWFLVLA